MKLAIMQPYIFPYIGYFQLVNSVDKFIFYDDVNYIKGGWINRNRILVNGETNLFTVPLRDASSYRLINETEINHNFYARWEKKFTKSLEQSYSKAPFYKETYALIQEICSAKPNFVANFAIDSIEKVNNYLGISTVFEKSSINYSSTKGLDKADRLIEICKLNEAISYVNPAGGKELYSKSYFKQQGIELSFIENKITPYAQFNNLFIGGLSIIDVLMFNSKKEIKKLVNDYKLI